MTFQKLLLLSFIGFSKTTAFLPRAKPSVGSADFIRTVHTLPTTPLASMTSNNPNSVSEDSDVEKLISVSDASDGSNNFFRRFLAAGGGKIGDRGEAYFFAQALPIMGIAFGRIPFISDALHLVMGPGLFVTGIAVMGITALDMGESLTPWPKPNGEGLVTTGLYSQVRHPMYFGLLSFLIGFAVWSGSLDRLLLVAFLWPILEIKAGYEEDELTKVYPEYPDYEENVQSRFIPKAILNLRKTEGEEITDRVG